jgi:hypothetical protein
MTNIRLLRKPSALDVLSSVSKIAKFSPKNTIKQKCPQKLPPLKGWYVEKRKQIKPLSLQILMLLNSSQPP